MGLIGKKNLALLIALSLFLFGCVEFLENRNVTGIVKKKPTNETNVTIITNVTNITNIINITKVITCEDMNGTEKESCLIERAYTNNNPADCAQLKNETYALCIYRIAERNYQYCSLLDNSSAIDLCYLNISTKIGDLACVQIANSSMKSSCSIVFIAQSCRQMTNESERYICDAIAKNDSELCKRSSAIDVCYLRFSRTHTDICSKIGNDGIKTACSAILTNNTALCNTLTGVVKDNCYQAIAVETWDCTLCENVVDGIYKNNCYSDCALTAKDSTQCTKPSEEQRRDNCYYNYAITMREEAVCKEIRVLSLLKICVETTAIKKAAPAACEAMYIEGRLAGVPTQGDINTCYYNVIGQTNVSISDCIAINASAADTKGVCIMSYTRRTKDTAFCASISDDAQKAACLAVK